MKADIREYTPEYWQNLSAFIRKHWASEHPLLNQGLFEWQYAGFELQSSGRTLLLFIRDELIGFLGLIPGKYQVNGLEQSIVDGSAIAMWMIHPQFRQAGLGPLLLQEAEKRNQILTCLGANQESGAYFTRRAYANCPRLTRWVAPLQIEGYIPLLAAEVEPLKLVDWHIHMLDGEPVEPAKPEPQDLETLWINSTRFCDNWVVQGIHRNSDFWQWRYLQDRGFEYLFFGEPPTGPVLVGRIEKVQNFNLSVFRIIEAIPANSQAWIQEKDDALQSLIRGVLTWACQKGCVAADYQSAHKVLSPTLDGTGMRRQEFPLVNVPTTSLAPVFQPLLKDKPPINVYWKVQKRLEVAGHWYFAKSDGDMDRPHANI